jgi:small subunit ribosomal protein S1
MVHVSELAMGRVRHPEEVLHVGQQVEVAVLRIEQTGNPKRPEKIALSIRALAKDPWSDVADRYRPGNRVQGRVTRTQPFGAFVELEPGVEGMVHVSELGAGRRVNHPDEVLNGGQTVTATVLTVEPERRRIGLSLNADSTPVETSAATATSPGVDDGGSGLGTLGDILKAELDRRPDDRRRG